MTSLSLTNLDPYAKRLTALANKAGAGLPTTKITAKTWNTVLGAALDRLEAPPAAAPAVITSPTPEPAPTPPTAAYGPRLATPAFNVAEDAAKLGLAVDHNAGHVYVYKTPAAPLPAGISFEGYTTFLDGDGVRLVLDDPFLGHTKLAPVIIAGANGPSSTTLILNRPRLTHRQPFQIGQQSALSLQTGDVFITGGDIHDTTGTSVNATTPGKVEIRATKIGAPGKGGYFDVLRPGNNLHCESVFGGIGSMFLSGVIFDWSDHEGLIPAAVLAGPCFFQNWVPGDRPRAKVVMEDCELKGFAGLPMHYPITFDGRTLGIDGILNRNKVERGPSAYISRSPPPSVVLTGSGNTDLAGANIDAVLLG